MIFPRNMFWHPLPLSSSIRSAPSLLVQTHFTSSSYTVHVTDLCRIWTETLDRTSICSRAAKEETTIDPSEDESQLQLLLEKLEGALQGSRRDVELHLCSVPRGAGCDLRLKLAIELSDPLPELEWTFVLRQGSGVEFTNVFVLPLLSTVSTQTEKIEGLVEMVEQKDKVIEKMKDALEDSKVKVEQIVGIRRRRAMVPFVKKEWEEDFRNEGEKKAAEVVREVYGMEAEMDVQQVKGFPAGADDWWKGIEDADDGDPEEENTNISNRAMPIKDNRPKVPTQTEKRSEKRKAKSTANSGSEDEENIFETLPTPPRPASDNESVLKRTKSKPDDELDISLPRARQPMHDNVDVEILAINEETDDDADLDTGVLRCPSKRISAVFDTSEPQSSIPEDFVDGERTIGKTGGHKPKQVEVMPEEQGITRPEYEVNDSRTPKVKAGAVKRAIGKIGGKKGQVKEDHMRNTSPMAQDISSVTMASSASHSLPPPQSLESVQKPRDKSPTPESEDEDTKADRKRRQLEKELEAIKKAPAKKKRRF